MLGLLDGTGGGTTEQEAEPIKTGSASCSV